MADSSGVLVVICTYQRNVGLAKTLRSLLPSQVIYGYRVLIVDNNPDGSARGVLDEFPWAMYVHEPRPGIPSARNAALSLRGNSWGLVFLDDDEFVSEEWFRLLVDHAGQCDAHIHFAPVLPAYGPDANPLLIDGQFFERRRYSTDTAMPFGPTNNVFIRTEILDAVGPLLFDVEMSTSGGSDVDFFRRLTQLGAVARWFDDAVVFEDVPANRANYAWLALRFKRVGNNQARLMLYERRPYRVVLSGISRVALGAIRMGIGYIRRRPAHRDSFGLMHRGLGMIGYLFNRARVDEYARTETPA